MQQSEQAVRQAQAKNYDLQQGARPEEIEVLKAQLAEAQANELLAKLEKDRIQKLVKSGSASASTLDQLMASWRAAQARVATIQSNIQVAELAAREHTLEVAVAQQKAAEATRDEVNWQLQQRTVHTRREGRVEDVFHQLGEYVNAGTPVVMLLPDDALKVRFYLPQHKLSQLQPGSQVKVYRDGQSQAVSAQVSFISDVAEFTPPVIFSAESRDKLVYRVEAQFQLSS